MHRRFFIAVSASALMLAALLPAAATAKSTPGSAVGTYIVQMEEAPAVAYAGDISGLAATQPAKGKKIDPTSATVINYVAYLKGQHDATVAKLPGATKMYDYTYSFNGFAA